MRQFWKSLIYIGDGDRTIASLKVAKEEPDNDESRHSIGFANGLNGSSKLSWLK
jgi:hypothetical protein